MVFYGGAWHLFRNKWKSQFRGQPIGRGLAQCWAACISGNTIAEVKHRLAKAHSGYKFGAFYLK